MDSQAVAQKLAAYDANPVTSAQALNDALGQFGVPEIRNTVSGLRTTVANTTNALNNVDPSVTGRTSGSLVTEAQRQRMVANERSPIAQNLTDENNSLNQNQQTLQEALGQATQTANNRVSDYQAGRSALQSQYDTTYKREQDAAQAAREAAAAAESTRQFNASLASSNANAAASRAASGSKASAGDTKAAVAQHVAQGLAGSTGRDGYVSNETFAAALNDYQAAGLGNVRAFWQNYGRFVNPKYKSSYAGYAQR